jgi:hypothetical protein
MILIHGHLLEAEHFAFFSVSDWRLVQFSPKICESGSWTEYSSERMIGQEVKPHDTRQLIVHLST